jgi:type IV pilus assembly protein PilA
MIRNIRNKIRKNRGFTLVELMIVVAIVGILAALAIYGVTRYMKNAKTAEARNSIGQIAKDAAAAYSREKMAPGVMGAGDSTAVSNSICKTASAKVPVNMSQIQAMKYQSSPAEWAPLNEAFDVGWTCLKFSMDQPQYYRYDYTATATDPKTDTFDAVAEGDLDGDGTDFSKFTLSGGVQNGTVAISPSIKEENAEE